MNIDNAEYICENDDDEDDNKIYDTLIELECSTMIVTW